MVLWEALLNARYPSDVQSSWLPFTLIPSLYSANISPDGNKASHQRSPRNKGRDLTSKEGWPIVVSCGVVKLDRYCSTAEKNSSGRIWNNLRFKKKKIERQGRQLYIKCLCKFSVGQGHPFLQLTNFFSNPIFRHLEEEELVLVGRGRSEVRITATRWISKDSILDDTE